MNTLCLVHYQTNYIKRGSDMVNEKRRFTRFPYKMKVELTVNDTLYKVEEIKNLSIGGCLLAISEELEPETPCSLSIILKLTGNEPTVKIEGVIVRSEQGAVAVNFTRIDQKSLYHLQKIARYNAADPDRIEREIKDHPGIV